MLNEQLAHFHEQRDEMIEQVRAYAASIETLRNQMLPIKEREKQASKLMYKGLCFLAGMYNNSTRDLHTPSFSLLLI